MGNMSGVFALTEAGRNLAREYLENNQYAGPRAGAAVSIRGSGPAPETGATTG